MGINFTIDIYIGFLHNNNIWNIRSKCLIIKLLTSLVFYIKPLSSLYRGKYKTFIFIKHNFLYFFFHKLLQAVPNNWKKKNNFATIKRMKKS